MVGCEFRGNSAVTRGGGLYAALDEAYLETDKNILVDSCVFVNNRADTEGRYLPEISRFSRSCCLGALYSATTLP